MSLPNVGRHSPTKPLVPEEHFPVTAHTTYLNAAAIGLVPAPVLGDVEDVTRHIATQGTLGYFANADNLSEAPRRVGAQLLGCSPQDIALVANASEAVSQIALSLRPGKGTNVVVVNVDIPAVTFPWLRLAEETGLEVRVVDITEAGVFDIDSIAPYVDADTAVIAVSQVQWVTGHRLDLTALAELARAHDAITVVDGYQAAGVVPLDVVSAGVDVLVAGSFKWLCGLAAAAFCYIAPHLSKRLRPALVGSMTTAPAPPFDHIDGTVLTYGEGARRLEYGSSSAIARYSLARSGQYVLDIGISRIFSHVTGLNDLLAQGIETLGGRIVTPRRDDQRAGILAASFDQIAGSDIVAALEHRKVICSARMGLLRFSPHMFNDSHDVDRALNALEDTLAEYQHRP